MGPCRGCHHAEGATIPRVPLRKGCYHTEGVITPRVLPCRGRHHAEGATIPRVPTRRGCYHTEGAITPRVLPYRGCHHAEDATIPRVPSRRGCYHAEDVITLRVLPDARADVPAADLDPAPLLRRRGTPGRDPSRYCRPSRPRRLAGKARRKAPEYVARCRDHLRVAGGGARERLAKTLGHMKIKHDKRTLRLGGGGKLGTHFGGPHIVVRVSELHHSDPGGPVLALRLGGGGKLGTRFGGPHTVACVSDPHNHLDAH